MTLKFEADDIVHHRMVERAQLLTGLADHQRARHACIVCDRFLGDTPATAVTLNAQTGNPYLFCIECISWLPRTQAVPDRESAAGVVDGGDRLMIMMRSSSEAG